MQFKHFGIILPTGMDSPEDSASNNPVDGILPDLEQSLAGLKTRTGRPKALVWEYFDDMGRDNRSHRHIARCKFCGQSWPSARVTQLKHHVLVGCKKIEAAIRSQYIESENAMNALEGMSSKLRDEDEKYRMMDDGNNSRPLQKRRLDSGAINFAAGLAEEAHQHLLSWFIAHDIPFEAIEDAQFTKAMRCLNSSYISPSSAVMSCQLLLKEYRLYRGRLAILLAQEDVFSFSIDGWVEIDLSFICTVHIILRNRRLLLWQLFEFPCDGQLVEILAEKISSIIREVGSSKVLTLVTSISQVIQQACKLVVAKPEFEGLTHSPCFVHLLGSLISACAGNVYAERIISNSHFLANFFTTSPHLSTVLHQASLVLQIESKLVGVDTTDVTTLFLCLRSIRSLERAFQKVLAEYRDKITSEEVCAIIDSLEFWAGVTLLTNFLKPLCSAMKYVQSIEATFSGTMAHFVNITNHIEKSVHEFPETFRLTAVEMINLLAEQINGSIARFALFMDPRHRVATIKVDNFKLMLKFATELMKARGCSADDCRTICNQLFPYKDNASPFCDIPLTYNVRHYWEAWRDKPQPPLIATMGLLMADFPVHMALSTQPCISITGKLCGLDLRNEADLNRATMVHSLRLSQETTRDDNLVINPLAPTPSSSGSYRADGGAHAANRLCLKRVSAEEVKTALQISQRSFPPTNMLVLNHIFGVDYGHDSFSSQNMQSVFEDATVNVMKRGPGREEFNVEDLILEFGT